MAEYIQSNDDSGNLALYGGLLAGGLVVGSALAYRASSPHYKKGAKGAAASPTDNLLVRFDDSTKKAKFGSGALRASTLGLMNKGQWNKGMSEMAHSVMTDAGEQLSNQLGNIGKRGMDDSMKPLQEFFGSYKKGNDSYGADNKLVHQMLNESPNSTHKDIYKRLTAQNPDTLLNPNDVASMQTKLKERNAKRAGIAKAEADQLKETQRLKNKANGSLDEAHQMNSDFDANKLKQQRIDTARNASQKMNMVSNATVNDLVKSTKHNQVAGGLGEDEIRGIASDVHAKKNARHNAAQGSLNGNTNTRRPTQGLAPGSSKLSASEQANMARRKEALSQVRANDKPFAEAREATRTYNMGRGHKRPPARAGGRLGAALKILG